MTDNARPIKCQIDSKKPLPISDIHDFQKYSMLTEIQIELQNELENLKKYNKLFKYSEYVNDYSMNIFADGFAATWKEKANEYKDGQDSETGRSEIYIILLGIIRKRIVDGLFKIINNLNGFNCKFEAFGSENITSDYDLTLLGKKAPTLMNDIYYTFKSMYDNKVLPVVFDTNLYCLGYYSDEGSLKKAEFNGLKKIVFDKIMFALEATDSSTIKIERDFAMCKYIHAKKKRCCSYSII